MSWKWSMFDRSHDFGILVDCPNEISIDDLQNC